jgi:hypothetical protein
MKRWRLSTGSLKQHESKAERTPNSNFQEFVPDRVEHMELDFAARTKKTATNCNNNAGSRRVSCLRKLNKQNLRCALVV